MTPLTPEEEAEINARQAIYARGAAAAREALKEAQEGEAA